MRKETKQNRHNTDRISLRQNATLTERKRIEARLKKKRHRHSKISIG